MRGKRSDGFDVDLGLALLDVLNQPRIPLTQAEIAAYCGCSRQRIEQIEKKALRKIRNRLRFGPAPDRIWHDDLMDALFNRRSVAVPKARSGSSYER